MSIASIVSIASSALALPSRAPTVLPRPRDDARVRQNEARLAEMFPGFRARVEAILADLETEGWHPRIQTAWLAREDAREKITLHHITGKGGGKGGRKEALAADIVDDDAPGARFWLCLAAAARRRGCQTGILRGLPEAEHGPIIAAVDAPYGDIPALLGEEPAHVAPIGLSVAEARHGKRPG